MHTFMPENKEKNMSALPEGCIANVLSFTTPKDVCVLSTVSSAFNNAAQSDTVWERFLPPDYHSILSSDHSPATSSLSKKQLFLTLCNSHILIDSGRKSFSLAKWSGKKSFMISARDLQIVWGDTPTYWKWSSDRNSRFEEVAELLNVCWLEINGKIDTNLLSPSTMYTAYLVFKLKETSYGLKSPVTAMLGLAGELIRNKRNVYLVERRGFRRPSVGLEVGGGHIESLASMARREIGRRFAKEREDGWVEIELGQFFNKEGENGNLEIRVVEVEAGHWKSGLVVYGVEIRPNCTN